MKSNYKRCETIRVNETIRLHRYNKTYDFAYPWYQDEETCRQVNGDSRPLSLAMIEQMYQYLDEIGELYIIEAKVKNRYVPIGDVTWWNQDMPIVIGNPDYRNQQIAYQVICTLIKRARKLGCQVLYVEEIYDDNDYAKACYQKAGFEPYEKTEHGYRYRLDLNRS